MVKEIFDYVSGKISHEEFEAELYINPNLWDEIQSLVPQDIADPNCPFRQVWGNMLGFETNNYRVKSTLTSFGYNYSMAHGLISALVKYQYPEIVCRKPIDDSPDDILEKIHMEYIGGNDIDDYLRDIMSRCLTKKELKEQLKKHFPCPARKHPNWVQEPEWPAINGIPMKFISQKEDGDKFEYEFQDITSKKTKIITQYA